jgi:hypothetical protein
MALRRFAILLREQFQADGLACEELLYAAMGQRKEWLFEFSSNPSMLRNQDAKASFLFRGDRAVESLRSASLEVVNLTRRLDPN